MLSRDDLTKPGWITAALVATGVGVAVFIGLIRKVAAASSEPWRDAFVAAGRRYLGTPYQWGGGHAPGSWGLDCSGLVIQALQDSGLSLPPGTAVSGAWWSSLPKVETPQVGDLGFYGTAEKATHVVIVTGWDPATKTASILGANDGDRTTLTPEDALARGAMVKEQPTHLYRNGFLGFASLADSVHGSGNVAATSFADPVAPPAG